MPLSEGSHGCFCSAHQNCAEAAIDGCGTCASAVISELRGQLASLANPHTVVCPRSEPQPILPPEFKTPCAECGCDHLYGEVARLRQQIAQLNADVAHERKLGRLMAEQADALEAENIRMRAKVGRNKI